MLFGVVRDSPVKGFVRPSNICGHRLSSLSLCCQPQPAEDPVVLGFFWTPADIFASQTNIRFV